MLALSQALRLEYLLKKRTEKMIERRRKIKVKGTKMTLIKMEEMVVTK